MNAKLSIGLPVYNEVNYVEKTVILNQSDINVEEISDYRWMSAAEVDSFIADETALTTPWFAMEWQQLKSRGIV